MPSRKQKIKPAAPPDVVGLYRAAHSLEPADFGDAAFRWLKQHVDFERSCGVTSANGVPSWVDAHFFNNPDPRSLMESQARVRHLDILTPRTIARPFVVHRQDIDDPAIAGRRFAPLREHLVNHWARYALCVALPRASDGTLLFVVLVRGFEGWKRFTDEEVATFQNLAPHFGEAFTINRRFHLRPGLVDGSDLPAALVDEDGQLIQTTPAFAASFWSSQELADGYLPPEVMAALRRGRAFPLPSGKVTLYGRAEPTGGWLVRLRGSGPLDSLSLREHEIAGLFARGSSYKAIAKNLDVAPATARNHLQKIYDKLGVSDRDQLAALLARP